MTSTYQTLACSFASDHVAQVTLARPEAANALNTQMGRELAQLFTRLAGDKNCRVVLLTGEGKHFCAGADLKERKGMDRTQWNMQHEALEAAHRAVLDCPHPVIAAVGGAAMGGGLELALAADFIYASTVARFGLTEVTLGIMPGLGGTQLLPRRIGISRAKELLFTGRVMAADEAFSCGLVNVLCKPEMLLPEAMKIAHSLSVNAPLSLRAIKKSINEGLNMSLPAALEHELAQYATLLDSKDRHEGINAFNEKRKPAFSGE